MSALEDLVARFQRDLRAPEREELRKAELEAMQAYNAIAHELAERIRWAEGPSDVDQRFLIYNNGWYDGRREAADLIDPEVTE